VRIPRIWLLTLAAVALAVPLAAEEIDEPQPRWQNAAQSTPPAQQTPAEQASPAQAPSAPSGVTASDTQQSGTPQTSATPETASERSKREKAEQELKQQEKQRVLGIVPSFNVSYLNDAVSLTRAQKMRLAFRSSVDPVTFGVALLAGGYHEVSDNTGYSWGAKGYGERAGAAYLDTFSSNMIGNGILPSLLHQDPRYFRLGHGSKTHRLLYAAAMAVVCKHDNTGKWEPNYSNIAGNIASGALSNVYYSGKDSGAGLAIENGMIVTAEGAFGAIFQEFWPDISRKLFHKDPTQGRDAQAAAAAASGGQKTN
jgi:hypothetical protein